MKQPNPCPLCGLTDKLVAATLGDPDDWFIECERCHVGTHAIFRGREATLAAWNTRPIEKELAEALQASRDLIANAVTGRMFTTDQPAKVLGLGTAALKKAGLA